MNYKITPTEIPDIFMLEDEHGKKIADVRGEKEANLFAHVPELLKMLDACVDMDVLYSLSEAIDLGKKLKPFRT